MNHISLCTGIGCESLAAEWAGFETVLHCENDPDCQKVLRKHWPNVPIIGDIHDVTRESVIAYAFDSVGQPGCTRQNERRISNQNKQNVESSTHTTGGKSRLSTEQEGRKDISRGNQQSNNRFSLTLLTAGIPCQPASIAGKRRGAKDDRWLWQEGIRVLAELQPSWAVFENPSGIGTLGELGTLSDLDGEALDNLPDNEAVELSNICRDIESCGYEVQPVAFPACAVGAPHGRMRIFIICHTSSCGLSGKSRRRTGQKPADGYLGNEPAVIANADGRRCTQFNPEIREPSESDSDGCEPFTYPNGNRSEAGISEQEQRQKGNPGIIDNGTSEYWQSDWYSKAIELCTKTQPGIRDVDAGTAVGLAGLSRTAKLKMLGNCNPPQQYYPIYKAIYDIEANL